MDINLVLSNLKELTLGFINGQRTRAETETELHLRINAEDIFNMEENQPQRQFITEVYVSLDHLTEEGFATSPAEMQYLAECFEENRVFSQEEVRKFPIGSFEKSNPKKPSKPTS
jgi:hypothetical protein